MEKLRHILWWMGFLSVSVVMQLYIEGLDALIVGVLIATHRRSYRILCWLVPLVVCLQEGMGSQNFGMTILYLAAFFVLYRLLNVISTTSVTIFAALLVLGIGGLRIAQNWLACILHDYPFSMDFAIQLGITQTIYTFLAWFLPCLLLKRFQQEQRNTEDL